MIKFSIPGLWEHANLNLRLLSLMKTNPDYFYDNIAIEAVYGNFPFCIFDGGRVFQSYTQASSEDIQDLTQKYNDCGAAVRLVFTNNKLTEKDYYDHFANLTMTICENDLNQIVIGDDKLGNYIREKYPKFTLISSTTKCLNLMQFKEELKKDQYSEICLDYNLNTNLEFLKQLTQAEKDKCEFLINAICPPGCKTRREHYELNSLFYLNWGQHYRVPYCGIKENINSPTVLNYKNNLNIQKLQDIYEPLGFSHFKLEGRTLSAVDVACNYVLYMVKPKYQLFVLSLLLR